MKKILIINICYIIIPLILSYTIYSLIGIDLFLLIIVFYGILLLFLLSPEIYLESMVDYNAKVINPTYRPEKKKFEYSSSKNSILSIVIVFFCLIVSILVSYLVI